MVLKNYSSRPAEKQVLFVGKTIKMKHKSVVIEMVIFCSFFLNYKLVKKISEQFKKIKAIASSIRSGTSTNE